MSTPKYPLIKLPKKLDMILYLIREELKSEKFFGDLEKIGFTDNQYQPHLGKLILMKMKLDDGSDEVFEWYYEIIERRKKKVKDGKSLMKQVMKVYGEMVNGN
jgi:hypothetical protein